MAEAAAPDLPAPILDPHLKVSENAEGDFLSYPGILSVLSS